MTSNDSSNESSLSNYAGTISEFFSIIRFSILSKRALLSWIRFSSKLLKALVV
jgi:hypothetical protein